MRIIVDRGSPPVRVVEPDDFGKLHVEHADVDVARVLAESGLGTVDEDGHAWLDLPSLRALAEPPDAPAGWADGWQAMVDYARGKGWLREQAVRVHIVAS